MSKPRIPADPPAAESLASLGERADELHRERQRAFAHALDAERQYVEAAWRDHQAGQLDWHGLVACYERVRGWGVQGFSARWKQIVPHDLLTMRRFAETTPDSDDGVWRGDTGWPIPKEVLYPPRGVHVAYALLDARRNPVLVSVTYQFRACLKRNYRQGREWSSWIAVPCSDRADALAAKRQLQEKCEAEALRVVQS